MSSKKTNGLDPITTQVVRSTLVAAAEEMRLTMVRTAYSPLLYEIQDFGVAILNTEGEMLAQGTSMPVFSSCLQVTVRNGLKKFGINGFNPGDIIIANDPFTTGTHISDTSIYIPIIFDGSLQGFSAVTGHWADIGGIVPGGWCPNSTDVIQEGMTFPHLKLFDDGVQNDSLMDYINSNNRFPNLVRGDLKAQMATAKTGVERYLRLCEKYGADTVRDSMGTVMDQTEVRVRKIVSAMPNGTWSAESFLDHDGVNKDIPRTIKVTVTIEEDEVTVDFDGTSETAGGPINIPLAGARSSAEMAFKSATLPLEPSNEGHVRSLNVKASDNLLTNPSWPAPCDSYGYASVLITDLVSEALANAVPDRCPAGEYMLFGAFMLRVDPKYGEPFIAVDPVDGGGGALSTDDGADALIFHMDGDVANLPAEVCETRYPLRMERYELRTEEYGIGKFRGGLGVIRDYCFLEDDCQIQIANELTQARPHGLNGGHDGGINSIKMHAGSNEEELLTERATGMGPFKTGDVISLRSAGGGGYGDPLDRDPERVRKEIQNGIVSSQQAKEFYGVVATRNDSGFEIDQEGTKQTREERRTI
tara:strand:- start:521 stop:2284 length:1764 start_codon:yes stop_codon:yes gene_type:complete